MNDKVLLLSKEPIFNYKPIILLIMILLISICLIKTYDTYTTVAKVTDNTLTITIPYDYTINTKAKIEYNNQIYTIQDIQYNEPYIIENTPYLDLNIKSDLISSSSIIKIKILQNKQRIITKLIKNIKGE